MFGIGGLVSSALGAFGGGGSTAPAGPVTTTTDVATGPISFGAKVLGRGASSSENQATGGAAILPQSPANNSALIVAAVAALALVVVLAVRRK